MISSSVFYIFTGGEYTETISIPVFVTMTTAGNPDF